MKRVLQARYRSLFACWTQAGALVLSCLVVSACSDIDSAKETRIDARSPEEAVSQLSESSRQSLLAWKDQPIKSCDPSEALGLQSRGGSDRKDYEGVDGAALVRMNRNSLVFRTGNAGVVLTDFDVFAGQGTQKIESSVSVNGERRTLSAETRRSGSNCELFVYGQKIFETKILQSFTIGLEIRADKQIGTTGGPLRINPVGQNGYAISDGVPILEVANEAVRPDKSAPEFFARRFNLSKDRAAELFKIGRSGSKIARIANEPSSVWSLTESRGLLASPSVLETYLKSPNAFLPLELRLELPRLKIGNVENSEDRASWKLRLHIAVEASGTATRIRLQNFKDEGLQPFQRSDALKCAEVRLAAYNTSNTGPSIQLQPSVPFLFEPCRVIDPDVETVSYDSGLMKSFIPVVFKGVAPARFAQYGGWDAVLTRLTKEAIAAGKDLRRELDPTGETRIVPTLAQHMDALRLTLDQTSRLKAYEERVFEAGYRWTFSGYQLSIQRIDEILRALDNAVDPFEVSTLQLLQDLSSQPSGFDDQLRFAAIIDNSIREAALRGLQLANDLDYKTYRSDVFNMILQRRINAMDLNEWVARLSDVKTEISPFKKIGSFKDQLVSLSVKWLRSQEIGRGELRTVYAGIDRTASAFPESTRTLLNDLSKSYSANRETVEFAAAITPEYEAIAASLQSLAKRAEHDRWRDTFITTILQKRPTLLQLKSWNEMWSAIVAFNLREAVRVKDEYGSTNDWNRKEIVETAIKEVWSNTDFSALETIAELARLKTSCERHRGMSSLATCGGRSLFSRQTGLLLDPVFNGRYSKLARELTNHLTQFRDIDAFSLKNKITSRFFGSWAPLWSKCANPTFESKASALTRSLASLRTERDQIKKWEIERQMDKTLEECQ